MRGRDWTVLQIWTYADCEGLRLESTAGSHSQTLLLPFDRPRRVDIRRLEVVHRRKWLHAFERLLLDVHPYGGLRFCSPTIELIPYQLEPALAMLREGHPRLLIADDVGLGKTIEAGVILQELAQRDDGFRALVLVPAGLRQQWSEELDCRFSRDAVAADAAWLRALTRVLPSDVNPWSLPGIYLSSFDFVKRPEALRPLEDVRWDLLVVDEAHAAGIGTDRRAAVDAIASRSRRVILLTATPPLDPAQFAALCRIGADAGDPAIVMFQRSRGTEGGAVRRSVVLAVRISEEERRMHRLLERYTTLVWRETVRRADVQGRLATIVMRKRALSSAASLEVSIRRRQELQAGLGPPPELQLLLPLDDEDGREDVIGDDVLGSRGLSDSASERRWLSAVRIAAEKAALGESKLRVLVKLLKRIREPAIVFTEYRDTLERLRQALLQANLLTSVLHGGLSAAERRGALADFRRRQATLLATDAAAEGLNLQGACRLIVHYELPWNPSRMLQRAGRVDRIGQTRRVHEIALVASDTAESLVLAPLARRAIDRRTTGASRMLELLTESRVAEAIFEGTPPDTLPVPTSDAPRVLVDLRAEATAEALRLQHRRTLMALSGQSAFQSRAAIPVTVLRRSSLQPGVILLFERRSTGSSNAIVERSHVVIHVALRLADDRALAQDRALWLDPWPRRPAQIRLRVMELLPAILAAVSSTLGEVGRRQLESVRPRYVAALLNHGRRESGISKRHDSAARQLVQAGLFDRRAVRASAARLRAADVFEEATHDASGHGGLTSSADLRAVLLVSRP